MEKFSRFIRKHLFRVVAAIVLLVGFVLCVAYTESWFWLFVELLGFIGLGSVVISIDEARNVDDEPMEL